ncbi:hypothetical protein ACO0QE_001285 [Hanseniaspora vineae]
MVNFHFNGSDSRLVCTTSVADIPTTNTSDQLGLYSKDENYKILELAYLKLKGSSYNHVGSNTAIDTFLLSGFIPEILKIRDLPTWEKLLHFYKSGLCTIAFGTKKLFSNASTKFISGHDYAVHDFSDSQISLINPWAPDIPIEIKKWSTFIEYFDVAYVNWNSKKMFRLHEKIHFSYNAETNNKNIRSTLNKPAFIMKNDSLSDETVYVLLEKHLSQEHPGIHLEVVDNSIAVSGLTKYKNNTGFHLLKVLIGSKTQKKICCFSELSARFTLHMYSISDRVTIKKAEGKNVCSVSNVFLNNYSLGSEKYCMNQTYKLEFADINTDNKLHDNDGSKSAVFCTVQLLAAKSHINFQLYHLHDFSLEHPLISENVYEFEMQTKFQTPLLRNKQYKLVCSSKDAHCGTAFSLACSTDDANTRPKLTEYYNYFGGLYKAKFSAADFTAEETRTGTKLSVLLKSEMGSSSDTWNIRLFNVFGKNKNFTWSMKVIDQEYGNSLLSTPSGNPTFTSNTAANVGVNANQIRTEVIDLEMLFTENIGLALSNLVMEIGSQHKLSKFEDHFDLSNSLTLQRYEFYEQFASFSGIQRTLSASNWFDLYLKDINILIQVLAGFIVLSNVLITITFLVWSYKDYSLFHIKTVPKSNNIHARSLTELYGNDEHRPSFTQQLRKIYHFFTGSRVNQSAKGTDVFYQFSRWTPSPLMTALFTSFNPVVVIFLYFNDTKSKSLISLFLLQYVMKCLVMDSFVRARKEEQVFIQALVEESTSKLLTGYTGSTQSATSPSDRKIFITHSLTGEVIKEAYNYKKQEFEII